MGFSLRSLLAPKPQERKDEVRSARGAQLVAGLIDELDDTLGLRYWQLYYAVSFWNNIATPLNLVITILSAFTTAEVTGGNNKGPGSRVNSIVVALTVITTLNTFLRPAGRVADYMKMLTEWRHFGTKFEQIFYSSCNDDSDARRQQEDYQKLLLEVNAYEASTIVHPFTESIAWFIIALLNRDSFTWMEISNPDIYACGKRAVSHTAPSKDKFDKKKFERAGRSLGYHNGNAPGPVMENVLLMPDTSTSVFYSADGLACLSFETVAPAAPASPTGHAPSAVPIAGTTHDPVHLDVPPVQLPPDAAAPPSLPKCKNTIYRTDE